MTAMGSKNKIESAKNSATERRQHNQKQESNGQTQLDKSANSTCVKQKIAHNKTVTRGYEYVANENPRIFETPRGWKFANGPH